MYIYIQSRSIVNYETQSILHMRHRVALTIHLGSMVQGSQEGSWIIPIQLKLLFGHFCVTYYNIIEAIIINHVPNFIQIMFVIAVVLIEFVN